MSDPLEHSNPYAPPPELPDSPSTDLPLSDAKSVVLPRGKLGRFAIAYAGIALPIICYALYEPFRLSINEPWQDGTLQSKLHQILALQISWPMAIFLAYSVVCMTLLFVRKTKSQSNWFLQIGIFAGVPVTATYVFFFSVQLDTNVVVYFVFSLLAGAVLYALPYLPWMFRKVVVLRWGKRLIIAGILFAVIALIISRDAQQGLVAIPVFAFFSNLICATVWCFVAYLYCSVQIFRRVPNHVGASWLAIPSVAVWITGYFAAVRWSVNQSLEEYSKLPLEPPQNCYIATAAAQGHPCVVRSWVENREGRREMIVNRQLARLKCGELIFQAIAPCGHAWLRRVYDRGGPVVANWLCNPWAADIGYVLLLPAEWLSVVVSRILGGREACQRISGLYGDRP